MKWGSVFYWFLFLPFGAKSQSTYGSVSGIVMFNKKTVSGAQLQLTNEQNGFNQITYSNKSGAYGFYQVLPESNYSLKVIYPYADTLQVSFIQIILGEDNLLNIPLQPSINILKPIMVESSSNLFKNKGANLLENLSIRGNGLSDLLMHQPQAFIKNHPNGAASFSGQNFRYNAFYIDGVLQNDQFGLSPTGAIMGETGLLPFAAESFEQMQLITSPYDASLGNFTGAVLNFVSKSGKNKSKQEWYTNTRFNAQSYGHSGANISGPILHNKVFYAVNIDQIKSSFTHPYPMNQYEGETNQIAKINRFRQSLQERYGYDPGSLDQLEQINSEKISIRIDGKINYKNQITLNARFANGNRRSNNIGTPIILLFSNIGKVQTQENFNISVEWKKRINDRTQNRLLFAFNQHSSYTQPPLQPFPNIKILDGEGMMLLGSGEETFQNRLSQSSINLNNRWSRLIGKHFIEMGIEIDYTNLKNHFLLNGYGQFFYYSIKDFLQNRSPVEFSMNQKSIETADQLPLSNMHILKTAFFLNYKTTLNKNISFFAGIRFNQAQFLNNPIPDSFTQFTAIPILATYHNLLHTQSGKLPNLIAIPSPRTTVKVSIPSLKGTINIGTGIFSGRIPYAWLTGIQSNNGNLIQQHFANSQQLRGYYFNPIFKSGSFALPPRFSTNKGTIYLGSSQLKLPTIWRSTIEFEKSFSPYLFANVQLMQYYNITEIGFLNVNIPDPTSILEGPDKRIVYSPSNKLTIPMLPDQSNPYDQILLIKNIDDQKGKGFQYAGQVKFQNNQKKWMLHYSYGESYAIYDGNYSVSINHWKLNEQKWGRNQPELAQSDYSQGHRIYAEFQVNHKGFKKHQLQLSIHYNGQSGNPFSYVYGGKNLSGDDPTSVGYDLIYIPTSTEIKEMSFIPLIKNDWYYTPDQQREAFELYISSDKYLNQRRGLYAEKNGSRSPFTHRIDLKLNFQFPIKIPLINSSGNLSLELLNAANLINQKWGKQMLVPSNRFRLISFEGFYHPQFLLPLYSFDPTIQKASIFQHNNNFNAASSNNWMLQLGFRLSFY